MNKRKTIIVTMSLMLIASIVSVIGLTYALWIQNDTQEKESIVETGCFTTTFQEANLINLPNAYPITDSKGMTLTPYTFTIKNTCTIASNYIVNLERLSGTTLEEDFTKVVINSTTPKVLTSYPGATTTITNALSSRTLTSGKLEAGASIKYNLRIWIDNSATTADVTGDTLSAKVVVAHGATDITNAASYITSLAATDTTNFATDDPDGNVRYIGADPNNYVNFNGEKWRIIGVFDVQESESTLPEKRIKLIRDSIGTYSWDSSSTSTSNIQYGNNGYGINQWGASTTTDSQTYPGADIMQTLNSTYLTGGTGTCYGNNNLSTKACTFGTESDQIKPLSSEAQSLVDNAVWNTGTLSQSWSDITTTTKVADFYTAERSINNGKICSSGTSCTDKVNRTTLWTGLVGLMYPSDYGYSTAGGSTTNRATCLNTALYSWNGSGVSDCKNNSWLYDSANHQWTMTPVPFSSYAYFVFFVNSSGYVLNRLANLASSVRPVVFLSENVQITGTGNGSSATPYDLTI